MFELEHAVRTLLESQQQLLEAYEDACPKLNGRACKMPIEDRRDMFWRLADNDESLVFADDAQLIMRGELDNEEVFVECARHVWRHEGGNFVMMVSGDEDTIVILDAAKERNVG